jgi:hypothetical protein
MVSTLKDFALGIVENQLPNEESFNYKGKSFSTKI